MKIKKSILIPFCSISAVLIISLVISIIAFNCKVPGTKRIFIFPSADSGEFVVEYRYLNKAPVQGIVNLYIDELLLGSGVERTRKLFSPNTKVISCFQRDGTLYLDLSEEILQKGTDVTDIQEGIDLLKLNVKKNFPRIREIILFVNGEQTEPPVSEIKTSSEMF